ncbi:MAG: hypothetical protein DRO67_02720 [Candidatus Asgardarchaeum californiense]|nr:MAG: hypothetical protein DRO67_02720 [Candidatus Asgardarchaeum californiense]
MSKEKKPIGIILWSGKSLLDGERIAVIATGIFDKTKNRKTGDMIQTYIIRRDIHPMLARRMGEDKSICGDCKHKEQSTCYVNLCHGPINVFLALVDGSYREFQEGDLELFAGRNVRIGSYGDPAAVPFEVWDNNCKAVKGFTGYTHQWDNKKIDPRLKNICMASVDSIDGYMKEYHKAKSLGWRTFRVFADLEKSIYDVKTDTEFVCPASQEAGVKTDCEHCRACGGFSSKTTKDVLINLHADNEAMGSMWRRDRFIAIMKKMKYKKGWRRDYKTERKIFRKVCSF